MVSHCFPADAAAGKLRSIIRCCNQAAAWDYKPELVPADLGVDPDRILVPTNISSWHRPLNQPAIAEIGMAIICNWTTRSKS